MTFTEEDIEDDGAIRGEVAPKLQSLLTKNHPEIAEHYRTLVEEDYGLSPGQDLADMLVRALNNEGFAQQILNTQVSLRQVKISDIREEDLDLVLEMRDKFSDDDAEDKVGDFIQTYMDEVVTGGSGGGIGGLGLDDRRAEQEAKKAEETLNEIRRERARLESLKEEIRQERGSGDTIDLGSDSQSSSGDYDGLFDDSGGDNDGGNGNEPPLTSEEGSDDG